MPPVCQVTLSQLSRISLQTPQQSAVTRASLLVTEYSTAGARTTVTTAARPATVIV